MIVGIDIGTQSLKAVVLAPEMKIIGEHAVPYSPDFPQAGWAEQDPRLWEGALGPAIQAALARAGRKADEVKAIGIGGQLDGCVAIDVQGTPLHPCLIWMDRRADIAGIDADAVHQRCGVVLDATHSAAKIRWLKRHVPAVAQAVKFHVPVSYLVSRLTGAHVIDHATASTSMVYGLRERAYDEGLLSAFGINAEELPAVMDMADRAGHLSAEGAVLTGLPKGIPVAVGTGDDFSSSLGAGLVAPGRFINVLGTAEVTGALHAEPIVDPGRLVETHAFLGGHYFIENPGWLSGGALVWFRDTFRLASFEELTGLAAQAPPGSAGVTFIPALSGAMAPEWIASARGAFYGLTPAHGTAHLARALLEGLAFAMRDVFERTQALGVGSEALRIVGGGARSVLWRQIRADLIGLPAETPLHTDTSAIGAAVLAGKAAGRIDDIARTVAALNPVADVTLPLVRHRDAYDNAYRRYRQLFESLRPLF
ncbi:MAG TPA: FGGY family carbohydrate kinase [Nordella sp.]|nr:FGGY family carbohydrate kinase [Nordella sp.]